MIFLEPKKLLPELLLSAFSNNMLVMDSSFLGIKILRAQSQTRHRRMADYLLDAISHSLSVELQDD
jgi:hypothetical protein